MKLVHLVGFITKKFVTMQHGHMNGKFVIFDHILTGPLNAASELTGRDVRLPYRPQLMLLQLSKQTATGEGNKIHNSFGMSEGNTTVRDTQT